MPSDPSGKTSPRHYTLAEIDDMRKSVRIMLSPQWAHAGRLLPGDYFDQINAQAEDRLRTYMANGTSPEELQAVARMANTPPEGFKRG